jgi:vacuolar protein sorting-associated protein 72
MDMGDLLDSLSRTGFSAKQRRSVASNKSEMPYFRYSARFRRIPALESDIDEDDDD